jgi:hypothetical protein
MYDYYIHTESRKVTKKDPRYSPQPGHLFPNEDEKNTFKNSNSIDINYNKIIRLKFFCEKKIKIITSVPGFSVTTSNQGDASGDLLPGISIFNLNLI